MFPIQLSRCVVHSIMLQVPFSRYHQRGAILISRSHQSLGKSDTGILKRTAVDSLVSFGRPKHS